MINTIKLLFIICLLQVSHFYNLIKDNKSIRMFNQYENNLTDESLLVHHTSASQYLFFTRILRSTCLLIRWFIYFLFIFFIVLILTYDRFNLLCQTLESFLNLPYLHSVLVIWNNPIPPNPDLSWPQLHVPIKVS